ncbi:MULTISPECIES: hypothetical protein [unclassified Amycolatopsis]|uniref:hypothetical protein n=1 Tax=unclassified Amycolatopsis TaxID=2618356 RepID=UPI002E1D2802|nr:MULTISPECIES: hypothetical protein [unclassified Amycolatopsis]
MITTLNHRERATLRAVAGGHAEISCSCEPDLFIDGLSCCDQSTVHRLARLGLIAPARPGKCGQRVPALLTEAGSHALGEVFAAAA